MNCEVVRSLEACNEYVANLIHSIVMVPYTLGCVHCCKCAMHTSLSATLGLQYFAQLWPGSILVNVSKCISQDYKIEANRFNHMKEKSSLYNLNNIS